MTLAEYRARLKAAHLCRECKRQDAYTLGGRTLCAECAEKHAARERARVKDNTARQQTRKALRQRRRETGLCTICGCKLNEGHMYKTCYICREVANLRRRSNGEA